LKPLTLAVFLLSSCAFAQKTDLPAQTLHPGATQWELFVDAGNGVGKRSSTHIFFAGGRWGMVLTPQLLHGPLRGNLEFAVDVLPGVAVFEPPVNAFGAGFTPVILKWNFTSGRRLAPYFELGGGLLFTNHDVPANTNNVNFTPQGGFGVHFFTAPKRAITFSAKYIHVSNAGLERRNSGINASFHALLGYTWFR
jgi:lipid A 3-O-deacylase